MLNTYDIKGQCLVFSMLSLSGQEAQLQPLSQVIQPPTPVETKHYKSECDPSKNTSRKHNRDKRPQEKYIVTEFLQNKCVIGLISVPFMISLPTPTNRIFHVEMTMMSFVTNDIRYCVSMAFPQSDVVCPLAYNSEPHQRQHHAYINSRNTCRQIIFPGQGNSDNGLWRMRK